MQNTYDLITNRAAIPELKKKHPRGPISAYQRHDWNYHVAGFPLDKIFIENTNWAWL